MTVESRFELNKEYPLVQCIGNNTPPNGALIKITTPDKSVKYCVYSSFALTLWGMQLPEQFEELIKCDPKLTFLISKSLTPFEKDAYRGKVEILAYNYFHYLRTVENALSSSFPRSLINLTQQYLS